MSNNAINVRPTFRDSTGQPRAYGKLYFYENLTTTLATIYSDEALTTTQSNPYTLDAYGRVQGDIHFTGKLTIKATNFDGSDPITDDNVQAGLESTNTAILEQFEVVQSDPTALTVKVKAGRVMNGETLVSIADQTTTAITAPTSNPRIDRIVIDRLTGVYSWVTGSEAASPTAPAITAGKMPAAQILLQTTTTAITDSMITDERVSGSADHSNNNSTETLTNKTIGDSTDNTKAVDFDISGATTAKTTTLDFNHTDNRTISFPDATDTLVGKATTDTLTNKTIGATNTINAQSDAFDIQDATDNTKTVDYDVSGATTSTTTTLDFNQTANRTITIPDATDTLVGKATTDTLTNKTLTAPVISTISNTGTLTLPTSTDTLVGRATTDTLTNKTLTNPIISTISNTGTLTLPTSTDTLVGRATTDTLTNKTLTSPNVNEAVALTATATELNVLDGISATTSQINNLVTNHRFQVTYSERSRSYGASSYIDLGFLTIYLLNTEQLIIRNMRWYFSDTNIDLDVDLNGSGTAYTNTSNTGDTSPDHTLITASGDGNVTLRVRGYNNSAGTPTSDDFIWLDLEIV